MGHVRDVTSMKFEGLIEREWLATNGLGGYASSTIASLNTAQVHGLLVAAMTPPVRRMVLLSRVEETIVCDGWPSHLAANEYGRRPPRRPPPAPCVRPRPLPRWVYQGDGWTLEKSLVLLRGQNTVCLTYTLLGGGRPVDLLVTPLFAARGIHELMYQWNGVLKVEHDASAAAPRAAHGAHARGLRARRGQRIRGRVGTSTRSTAASRSATTRASNLWTPGAVRMTLAGPPGPLRLLGRPDRPREGARRGPRAARQSRRPRRATLGRGARWQRASRTRRVCPSDRRDDGPDPAEGAERYLPGAARGRRTRSSSAGCTTSPADDARPPSCRSTRGRRRRRGGRCSRSRAVLVTGRYASASLLKLAGKLRDGLLPSEFPEDGGRPLYTSSDVALVCLERSPLPPLHRRRRDGPPFTGRSARSSTPTAAARLGIRPDADGLLRAGEPGDARGDADRRPRRHAQVVNPRHGRPVELNALWYNARVTADLAGRFGDAALAVELTALAASTKAAFDRRFWNRSAHCCYDVVTDDGSRRGGPPVPDPRRVCRAPCSTPAARRHRRGGPCRVAHARRRPHARPGPPRL